MKRTILLTASLLLAAGVSAQQSGRIFRTEAVPFDTRADARTGDRSRTTYCMDFRPEADAASKGRILSASVDIPYARTDGCIYLHLENAGSAYTLAIDGRTVAETDDPVTPAEFDLTSLLHEGSNRIEIRRRESPARQIDPARAAGADFSGSYLYFQNKRSVADYEISLTPDSTRKFGVLDLALIVRNAYNYDEPVTVGYDIYTPQGKLLNFDMREVTVPGRSTDTVRFTLPVYGAYENRWTAGEKNPPLYDVMIFTRRDGVYKEYMPCRIGFGRAETDGRRILLTDEELALVPAAYNAAADRKTTRDELKALKLAGKNTVCPDYPQPAWFYGLCDELGLYVIDRAAVDAGERRQDRTVGGTPSNDPSLADAYLERVQAMYFRSRNHTCVIAYALGSPSGNGYNMYKAYQWLKSAEPSRPVLYEDADGEWNTDL